jgi:hypothetical protein
MAAIRLLIDIACVAVMLMGWNYGTLGILAVGVAVLAFAWNGKLFKVLMDLLHGPERR